MFCWGLKDIEINLAAADGRHGVSTDMYSNRLFSQIIEQTCFLGFFFLNEMDFMVLFSVSILCCATNQNLAYAEGYVCIHLDTEQISALAAL